MVSYSVVECNVELLPVTRLMAVDGEKQDVRDIDDRSESHNLILRLPDLSLNVSKLTSGLIDIIARAIDVPKLGRRWKHPPGGEPVAFIFFNWSINWKKLSVYNLLQSIK